MTEAVRRLGKYEIIEEIGKGGFATVYRARDLDLGREVALKVLDPLLTRDPVWVARFRREARAVATLDHPRIVTVHEIGQSEGALFIAMKLVEGGSLAQRLASDGSLPWDEAVQVVRQVAEALDYAHGQGVLHRDLKPANVLLDPRTGAVLTDFGFARLLADNSLSVSMSGGIVGTPATMAPEVWEGQDPTAHADVYALGCILYELVAGRPLFSGPTPPAVMLAHFKPLLLPEAWPEGTPPGLGEVLQTALAKDPAARYPRAGDLAAAVAALSVDRLAEPYAALQAAVAGQQWQQALALAGEIKASQPDYRDVAALERQALAGLEQAARAQSAAQWRATAEEALAAGDLAAAQLALKQWQSVMPEDPVLASVQERLQALQKPVASLDSRSGAVELLMSDQEPAEDDLTQLEGIGPVVASRLRQHGIVTFARFAETSEADLAEIIQAPTWRRPNFSDLIIQARLAAGATEAAQAAEQRERELRTVVQETKSEQPPVATPPPPPVVPPVMAASGERPPSRSRSAWPLLAVGALAAIVVLVLVLRGGDSGRGTEVAAVPATDTTAATRLEATITPILPISTPLLPAFTQVTGLVASQSTAVPKPSTPISLESAAQVVGLARWGRGWVSDLAYSADGQLVAVASSVGVYLYDAHSLDEARFLGSRTAAQSVTFSPDGQILAAGFEDGTIWLWQVLDGTLIRVLEQPESWITSVDFSPDGQLLASGSDDATIRLWWVQEGMLLRTLEGHTDRVWSVDFSPDGQVLASGSSDGSARMWRPLDGALLQTIAVDEVGVYSVAFSPNGQSLATGSADSIVRLWQVVDGALLNSLEGHTNSVESVAFSPDGETLASASFDRTLRLWHVGDGAPLHVLESDMGSISSIAFSPNGQTLVSASQDGTIRFWQVTDGAPLNTLNGHTDPVYGLALSPDGQTLASALQDGTIRLWRTTDGTLLHTQDADPVWVGTVDFSPDGRILASGGWDHAIRLWQVSDQTLLRTLEGHEEPVECVAFSPDGQTLASGSFDGVVHLWHSVDGELLHVLQGHERSSCVAFSPDGKTLVSWSYNGIRLWRVSDGTLLHVMKANSEMDGLSDSDYVVFSPDGETLISWSYRNTHLWRVSDGALLGTFEGENAQVMSAVFSPDGQIVAIGSYSRAVRLRRRADWVILKTLEGHTRSVKSVVFSSNGQILVSGSEDGTVIVWGVP